MGRYQPYEGVPFEERTPGDVLEEFYMTIALEVDALQGMRTRLESADLERLAKLERILKGAEVEDEAADPLVAYWDYRVKMGLSVDLELDEAPPRSEWDKP